MDLDVVLYLGTSKAMEILCERVRLVIGRITSQMK